MSPPARRRVWVALVTLMLALAAVNLILLVLGRAGSWVVVGGALSVAVGPLGQLLTVTSTGERITASRRGRLLVVGVSVAAAVSLVVAGISSGSAFTWVVVGIFLLGLVGTVVGVLMQGRKPLGHEVARGSPDRT